MPVFSLSRLLRMAIVSAVVALGGWYGFSAAFRDRHGQAAIHRAAPPATAATDDPVPVRREKDGPGDSEVVALRGDVNRLSADLAALHRQFQAQADQLTRLHQHFQAQRDRIDARGAPVERPPASARRDEDEDRVASPEFMDPATAQAQEAALMQEEHERSHRRAQTDDLAFSAQAVDNAWAPEAAGVLQQLFATTELKDTQLGGVQCRTTLCRIEVTHGDPDQRAQFELYFPLLGTAFPNLAMYTTESSDGSSSTVVYLAREGYPLPHDQVGN